MKFNKLYESVLNGETDTLFMIHRQLEEFFNKNKKEFTNKMAVLKVLKIIQEEQSDVKMINHVGKFFGYLEEPNQFEEFINSIMDLL